MDIFVLLYRRQQAACRWARNLHQSSSGPRGKTPGLTHSMKEDCMQLKTLMAAAVAAAFAFPVYAAGDKAADNAKTDKSTSAAGSTKSDGGAEAMFKSLDKNKDGFLTKAEVKGTPHEKDFDKLDKNHDGKLSRQEHAAAPEHAQAASGGSSARGTTSQGSTSSPSSSTSSQGSTSSQTKKY